MKEFNVGVIVGSLREGSFNKKAAKALVGSSPSNLSFEFLEIGQLALYNEDLDQGNPPAEWTAFREKVKSFDAFLFVTPEYNRSIPAVLKNALDVASRPWGQNVWDGKAAAIVSVTIGGLGAFGANHHLRQSLAFVNAHTMAQPESYVSDATSLFDESGKLIDEHAKSSFTNFMKAFAAWIDIVVK